MTVPSVFRRNLGLKALAVALSIVTWSAVVYAGNPPDTRSFAVHVPQEADSIPGRFVLVRAIPDVRVRVTGTRDHLRGFDPASLSVQVRYGKIEHAGTQSFPITVTNRDPDVDVESAPATVVADVDELGSRTAGVLVVLNPPLPRGYVAKSMTVTPSVVTLTGPARQLDQITVRTTVDMSQQKTNLEEDVPVQLFNGARKIGNVAVDRSSVHVTVLVISSQTSRASPVLPVTTGSVAAGHQLVGISVDPPTVTLSGSQDRLNSASETVQTAPISLVGLVGDRNVTVAVVAPAGLVATPTSVTVHIVVNATGGTPSPSLPPPPPASASP